MHARHTQVFAAARAVKSNTLVNRPRTKVVNIALMKRVKEFLNFVIASAAKQSRATRKAGLLRRYAPRNDEIGDSPHPEERPLGRVSKDDANFAWFETREDALLTMRAVLAEPL